MNAEEFKKVSQLSYFGYCHYLLNKYGPATANYFSPAWTKQKVTRTKEQLYCHHIYEDRAILLSVPEYAKEAPYYYQQACNLVYCNILEHLFLHVLIAKECLDREEYEYTGKIFGIGGVIDFIVPELIDYYAGWRPKKEWHINCLKVCDGNYNVFLEILKYYRNNVLEHPWLQDSKDGNHIEKQMYFSFNEQFHTWHTDRNLGIYKQIIEYIRS